MLTETDTCSRLSLQDEGRVESEPPKKKEKRPFKRVDVNLLDGRDWDKPSNPKKPKNDGPTIVLGHPEEGHIGGLSKKRNTKYAKKNKQKHRQTKKKTNKRVTFNRRMVKRHKRKTYKKR